MSFVHVIAGLGNPGIAYQQTRHNAGADWLEALAAKENLSWQKSGRTGCRATTWRISGQSVWLVKPESYMNESGVPLAAFLRFHRIPVARLLVVYDDITLPVGGYKISAGGGNGGHNGIRSLLEHTDGGFLRLRIGVGGKPHPAMDLADHVLSKFPAEQWQTIQGLFPTLDQITRTLIELGPEQAMNQFNKKFTL